jgi:ABC-type uncharacterized transport system fused permease/ATPase subunit
MVKEGVENPERFAKNQVKEAVIGALIIPLAILIVFLVFLFILSYTHVLGGPYGLARFFFWILIIIYGLSGSAVYFIGKTFRKVFSSEKITHESHKPKGHIRDAEIVDKD